jgi:sugar (pentulose or hexulose) kinase
MDLFTSYLVGSTTGISYQNAHSWGYFDKDTWTIPASATQFPLRLFPKPQKPESVVGKTRDVFNIPSGITVYQTLGDLQASMLPVLRLDEAVIHVGTSAQIAFEAVETTQSLPQSAAISVVPYFHGKKLFVSASLNGGNAFETFANQICQWCSELSGHQQSITFKHDRLNTLLNGEIDTKTSKLVVRPLFRGERHNPELRAFAENWAESTSLTEFVQGIGRGIIANLSSMMSEEVLLRHGISSIRLINRADSNIYNKAAQEAFPNCAIISDISTSSSSAYGAALFSRNNYQHSL